MQLSFRARLAAVCVALVAVALLAASAVWMLGIRHIAERGTAVSLQAMEETAANNLRRQAESTIQLLSRRLVNPVYFYDLYQIQSVLQPLVRQDHIAYAYVYDTEGLIIHDGQPHVPRFGEAMTDPLAASAVAADGFLLQVSDGIADAAAPLVLDGERLGGVRVGFSLAPMQQEIAAASQAIVAAQQREVAARIRAMLAVLALLLLAGVVVATWVSRNMIRPIKDLVLFTNRIERGDYDVSLTSDRGDELGDLMRAFQRMGDSVRRNTREIRHLAYHDSLSGLPNRLMFREALEQEVIAGGPVALLFLDLDDFKRVNDSLGHDHGDELLVAFGRRLRHCVAELERVLQAEGGPVPRLMVSRLGGDEFTVIVAGERALACAERLAARIVEKVRDPIAVMNREFFIGTSIGITVYPEDAASPDLLVKHADIAMYGAKISGKNCFQRYHAGLAGDTGRRLDIEAQLRRAVANGEFSVLYQPIVRVENERVVGAEALVRASRAELKGIPPAIFIPVAEEIGLIEEIGRQILQRACADAAQWSVAGGEPYVSVNLSARQLRNSDILDHVDGALAATRLSPGRLAVELTESSLLGSEAVTTRILDELRARQIRVWLDDFGTGFSGLSHLRRMPVDGVKIDRSFIADILHDPDDLALSGAIISMAHSLNMQVIAEGVESGGQLELLRDRRCNLAQGYLFGRPMTQQDFLSLLSGVTPAAAAR